MSILSYNYKQTTPSATWTITHGFNTSAVNLDVVVLNGAVYEKVLPENISAQDNNTIVVEFTSAMSGTARIISYAIPAVDTSAYVSISPASISHNEGDSNITNYVYTVTRTGNVHQTSAVGWWCVGTGTHPANAADFGGTLPTGTLNFAIDQVTDTITIHVSGDTTVESDEQFTVALINPVDCTIIQAASNGLILNDDVVHQITNWTWASTGTSTMGTADGCTVSGTGQYLALTKVTDGVYISSNYGATWTKTLDAYNVAYIDMSASGQYIIATLTSAYSGYAGGIMISSDYGVTWNLSANTAGRWGRCSMSDSGQYIVVENSSDGHKISSDYGAHWTAIYNIGFSNVYGIRISGDGNWLFAIGPNSYPRKILFSLAATQTWTQIGPNNLGGIYCALSTDGTIMFYVNSYMGCYVSTNSGSTWTLCTGLDINGNYRMCDMSGAGDYIIATGEQPTYADISKDSGVTWTHQVIPSSGQLLSQAFNDLSMSKDGNYILGTNPSFIGGTYRYSWLGVGN